MDILSINWRKVVRIQLLISSVLSIYVLLFHQLILEPVSRIVLCLVCFITILNILPVTKINYFSQMVQWLNILFLPTCFSIIWQIFAWIAVDNWLQFRLLILILFWAIALLMFIPLIIDSMGQVNNWIGRLIVINIANVQYNYLFFEENLSNLQWLNAFNKTLLILLLVFFIQSIILNKMWFQSKSFDIKCKISNNWFTYLLLIFTVWFIGFRTFIYIAPTFSQALWNWKDNFYGIAFTPKIIFQSIKSGVMEELERYLMIMTILITFQKSKHRLAYILVISSIIFGLNHFINLLGKQQMIQTSEQVLIAIGLGLWLSVLYLYFGKLWIAMIVHIVVDLITLSVNDRFLPLGFTWFSDSDNFQIIPGFIIFIIPFLLTSLALFGESRKIMERNLDRLLML